MQLRNVTLAVAQVAMALAISTPAATPQTGINPLGQQLGGSWIGELNLPNIPVLRVFMTYTPDGSILATSSNNSIVESGQFGAWIRTGDKLFSLTVLGFVYDEKGQYQAIRKIRATISLNDALDEFNGDGEADILDPAGNVVATVSGLTVHGKRIRVEPAASKVANSALKQTINR
jgi:hypothetical protein